MAWSGGKSRGIAGLAAILSLSCLVGAAVVAGGDTLIDAIALLGLLIVLFVTVVKIEWGFYAFLGIVLVIDQFEVPDFVSLTYRTEYFNNINIIKYLPKIEAASISPMELHLIFLVVVWVLTIIFRTHKPLQRATVWPLGLLFFTWLLIGYLYGSGTGGNGVVALWELRGLFYLLIMYFFVPQIIQTAEQIRNVLWVAIAGITYKALEGTYRMVSMGFSLGGHDALLNHEDPVFIVTLIILLLCFLTFGLRSRQRTTLLWVLPILLIGYYAANRRAAYASLAVSLLTFAALLPRPVLLRVLKYAAIGGFVAGVYAVAFWGSNSRLAAPINQIRSGFVEDEATIGERNFYSNLYRKLEDYNLAFTIRSSPLMGIGFGTKYDQPLALVAINYSLRDYMAHNNILWLMVKVGGIGFFLFWLFIDGFALRATALLARLDDPFLRAVTILIIVAVINQLVAAYFDLHLVRYRTNLYMGTLMGLFPTIERIAREPLPAPTGQGLYGRT
ncbi:MAG: O-antigen ligase family protein [Bacteroidota bacterium]